MRHEGSLKRASRRPRWAVVGLAVICSGGCGSLPDPDQPVAGPLAADHFHPPRLLVSAGASCRLGLLTRQATLLGDGAQILLHGGTQRLDPAETCSRDEAIGFVATLDVAALEPEGAGPLPLQRDRVAERLGPASGVARTVEPGGEFVGFSGFTNYTEVALHRRGERAAGVSWENVAILGAQPTREPAVKAPRAIRLSDGGVLIVRPPQGDKQRLRLERVSVAARSAATWWPPGPGDAGPCEAYLVSQPVGHLRALEIPGRGPLEPPRIWLLGQAGPAALYADGELTCDPLWPRKGAGPAVRTPAWLEAGWVTAGEDTTPGGRTPLGGPEPGSVLLAGIHPSGQGATLDLFQPTAGWTPVGAIPWRLVGAAAVLLPDGAIAFIGGRGADTSVLYLDPRRGWRVQLGRATMSRPRSGNLAALLLPSGAVFVAGGRAETDEDDAAGAADVELLDPPYLSPERPRPHIERAPPAVTYGATFELALSAPVAAPIEVVLMGFGSTAAGQDITQSHVELAASLAPDGRTLSVMGPPSRVLAPPGRYLLFALDASRIPSIGVPVALAP
jgi:hypothetical protein